jgi:NADPH:quinone reductase-like Zn-dependent oxidoreductase
MTASRLPIGTEAIGLEARAFWIVAPRRGVIRGELLRSPLRGELLVEALYSGVSRGTERLVFEGRVPVSEHQRMRAPHQEGDFPWPVKYGYSSVGRVRDGSASLLGREVFCLFPHQTAYVVSEDAVLPLPPGVPAERAVLAANLETSLNIVWDAGITAGDRVAVVGAGTVGAGVAYLAARYPGTEVELIDIDPQKAPVALALGVAFALPSGARSEADVVIHASGAPEGLETALALAGHEATVVEASWFGDRRVSLPLGEAFHSRRLRLVASQVGGVPAGQRARWSFRRRLALALTLLEDSRLAALVSGESPFDQLPAWMAEMAEMAEKEPAGGSLCQRITYGTTPDP